MKPNVSPVHAIWSKISFMALYSFFFLQLWFNIFWISFCATDMFLWKVWMYKLVMLCSHDHFQFEFHLTMQIYLFNWPQKFSRLSCLQKKSKNSFQPIFKSLNVIVSECLDWQAVHLENWIQGKIRNTCVIKWVKPNWFYTQLTSLLSHLNLQPTLWWRVYNEIPKCLKGLSFLVCNDKKNLFDQTGFL